MYIRQKKVGAKASRAAASNTPGKHSRVAQFRILFDGRQVKLTRLLRRATGDEERVILANWGWSKTQHNFASGILGLTARERLFEAIGSASSQVKNPPALYSAANLMFLTKASGRLPTLYFRSGNQSGRIRQQHGAGSKVDREVNKVDYFFSSKSSMKKFFKAALKAAEHGRRFNPRLARYGASLAPGAGNFHFEIVQYSILMIAQ